MDEPEISEDLASFTTSGLNLNSCLGSILARFSELDADGSGGITGDELAKHWLMAAQEVAKRPLSASEQSLIWAGVQRSFETMDVQQDGIITQQEWLHMALLELHPAGPRNAEILHRQIRQSPGLVPGLVQSWLEVDERACGLVTRKMLNMRPCSTSTQKPRAKCWRRCRALVQRASHMRSTSLSRSSSALARWSCGSTLVKALRPVLNRILGKQATREGEERILALEEGSRLRRKQRRDDTSKQYKDLSFGDSDEEAETARDSSGFGSQEPCDLVLFHAPGVSAPVVAQAVAEHPDGAMDLVWFDHEGKKQHATASANKLEPYRPVLRILASPELENFQRSSSTETCVGDVEAAVVTCPNGHALIRSQPSFWSAAKQCQLCQEPIPQRKVRMTCFSCKYFVCGTCYLHSHNANVGQNPAAVKLVADELWPRCPAMGHPLERFAGVDGGALCECCGANEIGSTGPYFLTCRRCHFQLCYACARKALCALLNDACEPLALGDSSELGADVVRKCLAERAEQKQPGCGGVV
ncbi:unnamed protein product [Effrenium voratum]|uniref:Uncharacterized protein n=1 Tax=Effrenium voratum TaxID=2562239 RepID=A0AA36J4P4_9DINO|nr:unnamed protein product [Effrenium voratum]